METYIENLGWKKVGTIIIVVCFGMIGFVILSFNDMDKKQAEVIHKNISKTKQQEIIRKEAGGVINSEFKPFSTSDYQLKYPADYDVKHITVSRGAKSSTLYAGKYSNTTILVEVYIKPLNSYETLIKPYLLSTYITDELPLGNYVATEFTQKTISDNPSLHRKIVFLEKNEAILKISFDYINPNLDTETEINFIIMLASIR